MPRYAIIGVPLSGPAALIAEPNDFASAEAAHARVSEIHSGQRMTHHTFLDVVCQDGNLHQELTRLGILICSGLRLS